MTPYEWLNGAPWWVKALATLGLPTAIAAFFLAQSAGIIPSMWSREHNAIIKEMQIQNCITSLTFEERVKMREQIRTFGTKGVIDLWCPWVTHESN